MGDNIVTFVVNENVRFLYQFTDLDKYSKDSQVSQVCLALIGSAGLCSKCLSLWTNIPSKYLPTYLKRAVKLKRNMFLHLWLILLHGWAFVRFVGVVTLVDATTYPGKLV